MSDSTIHETSEPKGASVIDEGWDMFCPLVEPDELNAVPCMKNEHDEIDRLKITGFDRHGVPCVLGRLVHVVHGIMGGPNDDPTPATLIVFEWKCIPRCSHRFRQVDIEVIFAAEGRRPGDLSENDVDLYTPQVSKLAPEDPVKSFKSSAQVTSTWTPTFGLSFGFAPYITITAGVSHSRANTTTRTYCRFIAGTGVLEGHDSGGCNAVTWTLFENSNQRSGVQPVVRTAVLLVRQRDDRGLFIGTVKTRARLAIRHTLGETLKDLVGLVPVDAPVRFNPGVGDGAPVVEGEKNGTGQSPWDEKNLGRVDLGRFLLKDEEWAVPGELAVPRTVRKN